MEIIRRFEAHLLILFYLFLLLQPVFGPIPELLLVPIVIYCLLISRYAYDAKNLLISVCIIVSSTLIIFLYLKARQLEISSWFLIVGIFDILFISVLLLTEAKKLKSSLNKNSYWLTIILSGFIILKLISPLITIRNFEATWINYPIVMLAGHVFINERKTNRKALTNLLKVILILNSLMILIDIKKMLENII